MVPCVSSIAYLAQPLILLPDELHVIHILFLCCAVSLGRLQCALHIEHALINLQAQICAGAASTLGSNWLAVIKLCCQCHLILMQDSSFFICSTSTWQQAAQDDMSATAGLARGSRGCLQLPACCEWLHCKQHLCLTTLLLLGLALLPCFGRLSAHVTLDLRLAGVQSPVGRFSKLEHGPACMKSFKA